jgi:long-chain alkane monooxygenase
VVPELQRRGVFRKEYEGTTLREYYFGSGRRRIADDHPAAAFRISAGTNSRRASGP